MVNELKVDFQDNFRRSFKKIKDQKLKNSIITQIEKIKENPTIGKPMKYGRKGTRELYIKPFRLSYEFKENELIILLLDLYHKYKQ